MRANWVEEEVNLLTKFYPIKTAKEMRGILPQYDGTQINRKAKQLGLKKKPEVRIQSRLEASLAARTDLWSDDEKKIVIEWYPKEGVKGVQERLPNHRSEEHIKKIAYRLGLNREQREKIWQVVEENTIPDEPFAFEMVFKAK